MSIVLSRSEITSRNIEEARERSPMAPSSCSVERLLSLAHLAKIDENVESTAIDGFLPVRASTTIIFRAIDLWRGRGRGRGRGWG